MAVVTQLQFRRGTAAQWTSANPTLAAGEFGYETDTGKAKIGNGSTAWNSLSYALTGSAGTVTSITAGTGLTGGTITASGTIAIDSTVATLTGSQTLTNKTISGASNTLTVRLANDVSGTLPVANGGTGITAFGTGVGTALGQNVTGSGSIVLGTNPTVSGATLTNAVITQPLVTPTFSANAYTLQLTDQGDILLASNGATAGTVNVPTNASVAFPTGTQITILQTGSGQLTIQASTPATTTIASTGATSTAPKLRAINSSATLIKTGTDTWYVVGDIS